MKSMQGKAVLVTGGSRGIGRAIALGFARSGANVAINYFRGDRAAAETEQEITDHGVRCLRLRAHLGDQLHQLVHLLHEVEALLLVCHRGHIVRKVVELAGRVEGLQ